MMSFKEAIEYGYIYKQSYYKGAPWICNNKQYRTWQEALAAANELMKKHQ